MSIYNFPHPETLAQQEHDRQMELKRRRQEIEIAKAQMSSLGTMPIDTTSVNQITEIIDVYSMLEHCGDLLATGSITPSEWMKLKSMLRSKNEEDVNLVKQILDAKVQIK